MSLRPLASLAVKMLGLYAFVSAVPHVSGAVTPFFLSGKGFAPPVTQALLNISGSVLQIFVGIGLWAFSDGIAHSAVPDDGEVPARQEEALTGIGFSVAGAYLFADSLVRLSMFATLRYALGQSRFAGGGLEMANIYTNIHAGPADLVSIFVQGALALYLLLGTRSLVKGLFNVRNIGRDADY